MQPHLFEVGTPLPRGGQSHKQLAGFRDHSLHEHLLLPHLTVRACSRKDGQGGGASRHAVSVCWWAGSPAHTNQWICLGSRWSWAPPMPGPCRKPWSWSQAVWRCGLGTELHSRSLHGSPYTLQGEGRGGEGRLRIRPTAPRRAAPCLTRNKVPLSQNHFAEGTGVHREGLKDLWGLSNILWVLHNKLHSSTLGPIGNLYPLLVEATTVCGKHGKHGSSYAP